MRSGSTATISPRRSFFSVLTAPSPYDKWKSSRKSRLPADPHRRFVRPRHRLRLPGLKQIALGELRPEQRMLLEFFERQPFHENLAIGHPQRHGAIQFRVADHGLGVLASSDSFEIVEESLAQHENAAVARTQVLLRAIGDGSLSHPRDEILIHD